MEKSYQVLSVLFAITLAAGLGCFGGIVYERSKLYDSLNMITPLREHDPQYKFIDPLLAYIIPSAVQENGLQALKGKIADIINNEKKNNDISGASVFLAELNRGRWIGVDENVKYSPASMLKVVIMVAYFKEKENRPDIFKEKLTYTADVDSFFKKDPLRAGSLLEVGKSYTVEELINKLIIDSDNGAEVLLRNYISQSSLDNIFNVLNIENPTKSDGVFVISPRAYSLFFRILYSATYLWKSDSEKVLKILSKTIFKDGIVAGLPDDEVVAHKFGEYVNVEDNQIKDIELHDCGIVYQGNSPYFLCVMTRGNNIQKLSSTIKDISSIVYENYLTTK